jgi:adenylate cyclase
MPQNMAARHDTDEARARLVAHLRGLNVPQAEIDRAAREGRLALLPAEIAMTDPARRRLPEVAEAAQVDPEVLRLVVASLGLPVPPDDAVVAGDADVEAARSIRTVLDAGLDRDAVLEAVRVSGQSSAVIARSFVSAAGRSLLHEGDTEFDVALRLERVARDLVPVIEKLSAYILRRHLLEAVRAQALSEADIEAGASERAPTVGVGFGDLSGYTRLGSHVDARETGRVAARLAELVGRVAVRPVQLVKLVGDGAMLVSAEPRALVEALLALRDAVEEEGEGFPGLHAGAAFGPAVPRAGDWFGHTVSLASRLCDVARPGSVVVDAAMREALGDAYRWSRLPLTHLRGVPERTAMYRVRRLDEDG